MLLVKGETRFPLRCSIFWYLLGFYWFGMDTCSLPCHLCKVANPWTTESLSNCCIACEAMINSGPVQLLGLEAIFKISAATSAHPCPFFSAEASDQGSHHLPAYQLLPETCQNAPLCPETKVLYPYSESHLPITSWLEDNMGSSCRSSSWAVNPQPGVLVVICPSNRAVAGTAVCTLGGLCPSCFNMCSACICF